MKVLVYDVAAENGGGLFVLKQFYQDVIEKAPDSVEWIFIVSQKILQETENVRVLVCDKPKRSWLHRLVFEYIDLPEILKKEKPELVVSLQNMPIKRYEGRQFVYLHQSLQYCPKKFDFLKKAERSLAVRQRIICEVYKNALPKSEHIFVQTEWIRKATEKWLKWPEDKITVVPVQVNTQDVTVREYTGMDSRTFFYPARAEKYKNHALIIEACRMLAQAGIKDYKVILTVSDSDGLYAKQLIRAAEGLPIEFAGTLSYQEVWAYYGRTVLLFPSYLETCGLPLLEARASGAWILASDMPFAREALDDYPNKEYFSFDSADELADRMKNVLQGNLHWRKAEAKAKKAGSLMEAVLQRI